MGARWRGVRGGPQVTNGSFRRLSVRTTMEKTMDANAAETLRSPKLFSDFNTLQFASVMGMVVFVLLLVFMTISPHGHGISADLPKVLHPVSMPGAWREDVMKVTILRD